MSRCGIIFGHRSTDGILHLIALGTAYIDRAERIRALLEGAECSDIDHRRRLTAHAINAFEARLRTGLFEIDKFGTGERWLVGAGRNIRDLDIEVEHIADLDRALATLRLDGEMDRTGPSASEGKEKRG